MLQQKQVADALHDTNSHDESEFHHVSSLAKKILSLSEEHLSPLYPKSYEVLYTYFSGTNKRLQKMTDEYLSANKNLTSKDLDDIYSETLDSSGDFHEVQMETGEKLSNELDEISALVENYKSVNDSYRSTLNDSVTDLKSVDSASGLKDIIADLIKENENMRAQTLELSQSLESSKSQISDLRMCLTAAIEDSMKDTLTDIGNRRWLESKISKVLEPQNPDSWEYCLALIDLDHFKKINDTFGHSVGDKVLRYFASILKKTIGENDVCARYGGEEFAVLLSRHKLDKAVAIMNEIRIKLESSNLVLSNTKKSIGTITASFGVTKVMPGDTLDKVLDRADKLLYRAKNSGRNQVLGD